MAIIDMIMLKKAVFVAQIGNWHIMDEKCGHSHLKNH